MTTSHEQLANGIRFRLKNNKDKGVINSARLFAEAIQVYSDGANELWVLNPYLGLFVSVIRTYVSQTFFQKIKYDIIPNIEAEEPLKQTLKASIPGLSFSDINGQNGLVMVREDFEKKVPAFSELPATIQTKFLGEARSVLNELLFGTNANTINEYLEEINEKIEVGDVQEAKQQLIALIDDYNLKLEQGDFE